MVERVIHGYCDASLIFQWLIRGVLSILQVIGPIFHSKSNKWIDVEPFEYSRNMLHAQHSADLSINAQRITYEFGFWQIKRRLRFFHWFCVLKRTLDFFISISHSLLFSIQYNITEYGATILDRCYMRALQFFCCRILNDTYMNGNQKNEYTPSLITLSYNLKCVFSLDNLILLLFLIRLIC